MAGLLDFFSAIKGGLSDIGRGIPDPEAWKRLGRSLSEMEYSEAPTLPVAAGGLSQFLGRIAGGTLPLNPSDFQKGFGQTAFPSSLPAPTPISQGFPGASLAMAQNGTGTNQPTITDMEQRWRALTRPGEQRLRQFMGTTPAQTSFAAVAPAITALPSSMGAASYPASDTLSNLGEVATARDLAQRSETALGITNNPGRDRLTNAAGGQQGGEPLFASNSQTIGTALTPNPSGGVSEVPVYETGYFNAQGQPVATLTGRNQRAGGGTVSQPDQGNGGTVEGNVAALNRQYDAVRSLNEALAGGRNIGSAGGLPTPPNTNPFERPGDSRLDTAVRQQTAEQGLAQALDPHSGMTHKQREAAMGAYRMFVQPGIEAGQQQGSLYNAQLGYLANQGQTQATLQNSALRALHDQQQAQRQAGLDQSKLALDQAQFGLNKAKTEDEFTRNAMTYLSNKSTAFQKIRKNEMEDWLSKNMDNANSPDKEKADEYARVSKLYDMLYNRGTNQLLMPTAKGE